MSERKQALNNWLTKLFGSQTFQLTPASEDASFRSYYRVKLEHESYIVMDAPPQHEDCRPFINITERLLACRVNVPRIHEQDIEQGFLLLSDFGDDQYLPNLNDKTADTLYKQAIDSLVRFQTQADCEGLPNYDESLLQREMDLFHDWLLTQYLNIELSNTEQESLTKIHKLLIANARQQPQAFVHRDYHSRNLMLTAENNPGIIDYQDAVLGPVSYDLVSLLKDCYIKWPANQRATWISYYLSVSDVTKQFDPIQFQRWFDLIGVQRQLKASGIFARLCLRDNKAGFIKDIPRTLSYITELNTDYPELQSLISLIEERVLPALEHKL